MPTQLISCPQKQVIRKYIRNVPCSQKNGRRVTCPEAKKLARQEIPSSKRSQVKYPQVSACVSKQLSKCMPKTCPERERKISTIGCPKCESNRIQKLECEVRYDDFRPSIDRLADFPGFVRSSNSCKEKKKKRNLDSAWNQPSHDFFVARSEFFGSERNQSIGSILPSRISMKYYLFVGVSIAERDRIHEERAERGREGDPEGDSTKRVRYRRL